MKKIMILIVVVLISTGCEINYNISITKDKINENLEVYEYDTKIWNEPCSKYLKDSCKDMYKAQQLSKIYSMKDFNYNNIYDTNENELYNIKYIEETNKIGYIYSYNFNIEDYHNSALLNNCIENIEYINENNIIKFHFSGKFTCKYEYIDKINLNIKSDYYDIKNSNENSKKNGIYTWNISGEENDIYFELHDNYNENRFIRIVVIIATIVAIITTIIFLVLMSKRRENNRI